MSTDLIQAGLAKAEVDDLQAAYAEIQRPPYEFTWADRVWTLPHIGELDYRIQSEIEATDTWDVPRLESLFTRMFGPEQAAAWAEVKVPAGFLMMLFERWVKFSGRKQGESPASNDSSESTGEKSRPTSDASTTSASPKRSTAARAPRKRASPRAKSST